MADLSNAVGGGRTRFDSRLGERPREVALERLHHAQIKDPPSIRRLLESIFSERVVLRRALNRKVLAETAVIQRLDPDGMLLRTSNFDEATAGGVREAWGLSTAIDGTPYYFVAVVRRKLKGGRAILSLPAVVYRAERRDRERMLPGQSGGMLPTKVSLVFGHGHEQVADVADLSPGGLGLRAAKADRLEPGQAVLVRYLDGPRIGGSDAAEVRSVAVVTGDPSWKRIGLSVRKVPIDALVMVEKRSSVGPESSLARVSNRIAMVASSARAASQVRIGGSRNECNLKVDVVEYFNHCGESIRAILNHTGELRGAPVVVIPPAWGKTKETLLPLAATILTSFERAGRPVAVLRFDGIRRRGESYNEPQCRIPGREYHRFTFSQGVRDIQATLDFLFGSSGFKPQEAVLVSFSAASVDTRKAVALEQDGRISGWINVVGAPDLQSAMRVVSGGIDFLGGYERGVRFGLQEIQGVTVDIDHASQDAIENGLAFLDDALVDMARIRVPITWFHGRFDAWMEFDRVKLMMGAGNGGDRRLVEVPTGHQLRSSVEAIEVFQLVASEVARMTKGADVAPSVPDARFVRAVGRAERARVPRAEFDPRGFWRDYLVGRRGHLGIELMTGTSAYADLMRKQIGELRLSAGQEVADLGCGTGSFVQYLAESDRLRDATVNELDYVREGLARCRERLRSADRGFPANVRFAVCDLGLRGMVSHIPLAAGSQDAVLASLLLSYIASPERLLDEIARILRPGGRLVVSSLRPDADTSRIYRDGADELRAGRARLLFGEQEEVGLGESLHTFLNDAAKLLELEEQGVFRFFGVEELCALVRGAGLEVESVQTAFGNPPQAVVLSATKLLPL